MIPIMPRDAHLSHGCTINLTFVVFPPGIFFQFSAFVHGKEVKYGDLAHGEEDKYGDLVHGKPVS